MASRVKEAFRQQGTVCTAMGSAFTGALCSTFADNLDTNTTVGAHCLGWTGDPGPSADSIPLRLCGGFHALVLSGADRELADHYPPHRSGVPDWSLLHAILIRHEDFLLRWMESPPQTNEVSRSAVIWPALMTLVDRVGMPLKLLEIGASGGLNLQADQFGYNLGGVICGQPESQLQLSPQWQGAAPVTSNPKVVARNACDLNPINPLDPDQALRLRTYLWPDQPERMQRLNAALAIAAASPAPVDQADAVAWLESQLSHLDNGLCTVIYSTVAWQYLPGSAQKAGESIILETARKQAGKEAPLAWIRFEADGESPGGGIRLQLWPDGLDCVLGRADFHARWVDWRGL